MLFYYITKSVSFFCLTLLIYGLIKDAYNVLVLFIYLEMILMSLVYAFVYSSTLFTTVFGLVFAVELMALAAIKAAVGLSVVVSWTRYSGTLSFLGK